MRQRAQEFVRLNCEQKEVTSKLSSHAESLNIITTISLPMWRYEKLRFAEEIEDKPFLMGLLVRLESSAQRGTLFWPS